MRLNTIVCAAILNSSHSYIGNATALPDIYQKLDGERYRTTPISVVHSNNRCSVGIVVVTYLRQFGLSSGENRKLN